MKTCFMGNYPQTTNGLILPIEWFILEEKEDCHLLISRYLLDIMPYNNNPYAVTWETSDVRRWLNGRFYSTAFNEEERDRIIQVRIDNSTASVKATWEADSGSDTNDKIFLMSHHEAEDIYGLKEKEKTAYPTGYAITRKNEDGIWYWTRTIGRRPNMVVSLNSGSNSVSRICHYFVNNEEGGIRPSMWVKGLTLHDDQAIECIQRNREL